MLLSSISSSEETGILNRLKLFIRLQDGWQRQRLHPPLLTLVHPKKLTRVKAQRVMTCPACYEIEVTHAKAQHTDGSYKQEGEWGQEPGGYHLGKGNDGHRQMGHGLMSYLFSHSQA